MIRNTPANINRYVPDFLLCDAAFAANCDAQSGEHERLRSDVQDVLDQFFVETATWGLAIWEDTVGLPRGTGEYDTRRANIKAKLMGAETTTVNLLERLGAAFVACEKVSVVEKNADYYFSLLFKNVTKAAKSYEDMIARIEEIKPAHLGYGISVQREAGEKLYIGGAMYKHRHMVIGPAAFKQNAVGNKQYIGGAMRYTKHVVIGVSK